MMDYGRDTRVKGFMARMVASVLMCETPEQFSDAEIARWDACPACMGAGKITGIMTCPMCGGSGVDPDVIERQWYAYELREATRIEDEIEQAWAMRQEVAG